MNALNVCGLHAGYGSVRVLHGIDFHVRQGEIVAMLGANGAGKTTTLRALSGQLPARGEIALSGRSVSGASPESRARAGLALLPQGRGTFTDFSVEENLELGAYAVRDRHQVAADIDKWYTRFPRLAERRHQAAGLLSGGEQQMLAIARALMSRPSMLLCDEPSLGLAPAITRGLFDLLAELNRTEGLSVLLVEQNADLTLRVAHRAYVLTAGLITVHGSSEELMGNAEIRQAYLGA